MDQLINPFTGAYMRHWDLHIQNCTSISFLKSVAPFINMV